MDRLIFSYLLSLPGASVTAVGEDAHHRRRPDPCSVLQGAGWTLSQLSDQTNHQQTATVHQQPHPTGEHRIFSHHVWTQKVGALAEVCVSFSSPTNSHLLSLLSLPLQLMKEPVLQDKRSEHVRFCRYAAELTERVSGKPLLMGTDVSLARLQKANVVAQSRITFSEKELLMLIRNHLVAKGLHDTANTLVKEANLSVASLCPNSSSCITPPPSSSVIPRTCRLAGGIAARVAGHVGSSPVSSAASVSSSSPSSSRALVTHHPSGTSSSTSALPTPPPPHGQGSHLVGRILFTRERPVANCNSGKKLRALKQKSDHGAFIQVSDGFDTEGV